MSDTVVGQNPPPTNPPNIPDPLTIRPPRPSVPIDQVEALIEAQGRLLQAQITQLRDEMRTASARPPRPSALSRVVSPLKGYRTIIAALLLPALPAAAEYLYHVDWTTIGISPATAVLISAAVIGLRAMTSTPIGQSTPKPAAD
jgi:hypothetical protein